MHDRAFKNLEEAIVDIGGDATDFMKALADKEGYAIQVARELLFRRHIRPLPSLRAVVTVPSTIELPNPLPLEQCVSIAHAREAMTDHTFFGPEEWQQLFGAQLPDPLPEHLMYVPWKKETLEGLCPFFKGAQVKETHMLFLGLPEIQGNPINLLNWELFEDHLEMSFSSGASTHTYQDYPHAVTRTCALQWYLMPLTRLPNALDLRYSRQLNMLPTEYGTPYAIEIMTAVMLYGRKARKDPPTMVYTYGTDSMRCADQAKVGHVIISPRLRRTSVDRYYDGGRKYAPSMAMSRKPLT